MLTHDPFLNHAVAIESVREITESIVSSNPTVLKILVCK
jgi:hypothetical protein